MRNKCLKRDEGKGIVGLKIMEVMNGIVSLSVHKNLYQAVVLEAKLALPAFLHVALLHAVLTANNALAALADQLEIIGVAERTHGTDVLL